MNPAGVVLAIAGIWVISQVFAGNALERLNILKPSTSDSDGGVIRSLPGAIIEGGKDALPGGKNNPPYIDFGKLFPNLGSNGYGRAL